MAKRRGTLRFQVPFTAAPPSLASESAGISRLIRRPSRSRTVDSTVLDADDNRLLRAGVIVTHRVVDGFGEWYLSARGWSPRLPEEATVPLGTTGELPPEFARLIRPLARGAAIGPVAALTVERDDFDLLDLAGLPLAAISDQKVTVRRGGVTTARFREATVKPSATMTLQQLEFVVQAMASASAEPVDRFPSLQQRLGPPATGLTDFPEPRPLPEGATMEDLVTALFATDLRALVFSLLDHAEDPASTDLLARLEGVRRTVGGLAHVLDPAWREHVEGRLAGVASMGSAELTGRALEVADALVSAVRAPRLGDSSQKSATSLLFQRAERATFILADRCRALEPSSADEQWVGAHAAAEQLALSGSVGAAMLGKRVGRTVTMFDEIAAHLTECLGPTAAPDLTGLSPADAFALGAAAERQRLAVQHARAAFVAAWPQRIGKLRKLLDKARKRA